MDDIQTLADRVTVVSPAEVEAALLDNYSAYVRLAYLILPPALGRHRRILAAHGVVQRVLPDRRQLERQLAGETDAAVFLRRRVVQDSIKQAVSRTPRTLLPQVWGLRLFARAAEDLAADQTLAHSSAEGRAAWALIRSEQLSADETEFQLRAIGVQHPQAAIAEAAALDEHAARPAVFDPCAARLAPNDLMHRRARGRAVAITVTTVLALAILTSLITTAGKETPIATPPTAALVVALGTLLSPPC